MSNNKSGCLGMILQVLGLLPKDVKGVEAEVLPYALRDDFLSPAEFSFYKVLQQVAGDKSVICPKVALKDLFFAKVPDRSTRSRYANKINLKHIDFLLCSNETMKPICGIELDDSSHKRQDGRERDIFVEKVFDAAGLPLVRFENKSNYSLIEVQDKITPTLTGKCGHISTNRLAEQKKHYNNEVASASESNNTVPTCKKCGIPMVLRHTKRGRKKGQAFYGCFNYPKCRETIPLDNLEAEGWKNI